jgi:REP element-mobilizing transposase RayT
MKQVTGRPVWQRNYYERVIRNEAELLQVRRYIEENHLWWRSDANNLNP